MVKISFIEGGKGLEKQPLCNGAVDLGGPKYPFGGGGGKDVVAPELLLLQLLFPLPTAVVIVEVGGGPFGGAIPLLERKSFFTGWPG